LVCFVVKNSMDIEKLRELIKDDDLGLLDVKPKPANGMTEDERLAESFFEITTFYREYGREPENDMANVQESRLAMRLSNLRKDPEKIKELVDLDEFGLLQPIKKIESIDDIFEDDDLDILGGEEQDSIFNLTHVPQNIEPPDYVANRKPCSDFDRFEPLFKQCHEDLKLGKRKLFQAVREDQINKGQFFVLGGVMLYLAKIGEDAKKTRRKDPRLYCVFENGTESNMLFRSLIKALLTDGRCVTEHEDRLMDDLNNISDEDSQTGTIYVLKSLSANPDIASVKDLYKIGFSTVPVEERIKNAEDDPTYLMAPVHMVETFECFNLNPQKLELLLHRFFGKVCLEVDVFDNAGKRHTPREWFIAPLPVIEEAIELIISGEIIKYEYDDEAKLMRGENA